MVRKFTNKLKQTAKSPYLAFIVFGALILVFAKMDKVIPPDIYSSLVMTMYYSIAGLGFALLLGYGGLASLGSGAFFGIGAFGFHYFYRHQTMAFLVAIAIALAIAIVVSIIFGFISLRISGMYLAIITMGLSQIVIEIIKRVSHYNSGSTGGFLSGGKPRPPKFLNILIADGNVVIMIAIVLTLGMIIVYNLIKSPTGRALLAIKNSESAAKTMGVNVLKYRLMAFVISGIYGALAGILGLLFTRNSNTDSIGIGFALNILAAVIVGGTRSVWGIILGSFIIFGLDLAILNRFNLGSYSLIFNGVLIILVVMFYPNGLIQLFSDVKKWYLKLKNKIIVRYYGDE